MNKFKKRFWASLAVAMALGSSSESSAKGQVRMPNGDYREQVEDMRVKVLGGSVVVMRTWHATNVNRREYRWSINPVWDDLKFEYDATDDSVKTVDRSGAKFERGGDGIYVLDRHYFIARQHDAQNATTGWRWYDRAGNWMAFSADGKALAYGDRNDVTVRFERNGPNGAISRVLDHHGTAALTLGYTEGKLTSITDRANNKVEYVYNGSALAEVVDVLGHRWKYEYTNGLLSKVTDPENHATAIEYAGGRAWRVTDPMNYVTTWEYDYNRSKRQYTVTRKGPEAAHIVKQTFDAEGRRLSEIVGTRETYQLRRDGDSVDIERDERGGTSRKTWDASGNVVKVVHADGTQTSAKFDPRFNLPIEQVDELGVKTIREYDAKGNLKKLVEAQGLPEQRTLTFTYDNQGQALTTTIEGTTDADDITIARTYDNYGNVATSTDGENNETEFEHDVRGSQTLRVDPRGKRWTSEFDALGRLRVASNPLGEKTRYEYDKAGNLTKTIDPRDKATTSTHYADDRIETMTGPDGGVDRYVYEKSGKIKSVTDSRGVTRSAEYDADGRIAKRIDAAGNEQVFEYAADGGGKVTGSRLPGFCDAYKYDQAGRLVQTTRTMPCTGDTRTSRSVTRGFDAKGRVVSAVDALGRTTLTGYDAFGRVVSVTDAGGGVTRYTFDVLGNIVRMVDPNNGAYVFTYDKAGRQRSESTPLGATIRFEYDAAGNLVERTSPNGERRIYEHDDAGRVVRELHYAAQSNVPAQTVVYDYNARGDIESYVQTGDTRSRANYGYDDVGRHTSSSVVYGEGAGAIEASVAYDYWPNGLKKSLKYPDGTTVAFGYNGANQIESAGLPGGGMIRWSGYSWRNATTVEAPGIVSTRTFDGEGRTTRQAVRALGTGTATAPNGASVMTSDYRYDAVGNLRERETEDGAFAYTYDALDRLLTAAPPAALVRSEQNPTGLPGEVYTFDALGNRRSSIVPGAWRYDTDNRLLSYGLGAAARSFDYDANGRTKTVREGDPATSTLALSYDATDRLREVSRNGQRVGRYQYDPFGRRIGKETAQGVVWFVYGDEGVLAELDASGASRRYYGYMPSNGWHAAPLWQAWRDGAAWRVATYHLDESGLPQRLADADGQVVWSLRSDAFGDVEDVAAGAGVDNPLRFAGQYRDVETGFNYNWHRNYVPSTGRYLEWDPLRREGGPNPYLYANANPLRFIDANGLIFEDRCNCNENTDGKTLWVGGSAGLSGMALIYGVSGGLGIYTNVFSGEKCLTGRTCHRYGLGAGASASASLEAQSGDYCGKGLGGPSCEFGISAVYGVGGRGKAKVDSIGVPGWLGRKEDGIDCGNDVGGGTDVGEGNYFKPRPGGIGAAAAAGAEVTISFSVCETTVLYCWDTPCACK
jgi:RHS repeat-associated protein